MQLRNISIDSEVDYCFVELQTFFIVLDFVCNLEQLSIESESISHNLCNKDKVFFFEWLVIHCELEVFVNLCKVEPSTDLQALSDFSVWHVSHEVQIVSFVCDFDHELVVMEIKVQTLRLFALTMS